VVEAQVGDQHESARTSDEWLPIERILGEQSHQPAAERHVATRPLPAHIGSINLLSPQHAGAIFRGRGRAVEAPKPRKSTHVARASISRALDLFEAVAQEAGSPRQLTASSVIFIVVATAVPAESIWSTVLSSIVNQRWHEHSRHASKHSGV